MKLAARSVVMLLLAVLSFSPGAWAQGCVLCYTSLAASGPAAMKAFELAMFALLIPALLLFLGVALLICRRAQGKSAIPSASAVRVYMSRMVPRFFKPAESRI